MPRATKEIKNDELEIEKKTRKSAVSAKKNSKQTTKKSTVKTPTRKSKQSADEAKKDSSAKKNLTTSRSDASQPKKKSVAKKSTSKLEESTEETKKKSTTKKSSSTTKKTSTAKKATSTKKEAAKEKTSTKKTSEKKETKTKKVASTSKKETKASKSTSSKNDTKKIPEKEETTVKKAKNTSSPKKTTAKKSTTTKKDSSKSTTTTKKRATKKSKKIESNIVAEYYDLPYRYNETIVKILYQTPNVLFVYWDISDYDRNNFINQYGTNFFNDTKPILKIYNLTKNYNFEIEINDFANSWYINVNDANCEYKVELGRKPIYYNNINTDYIYVSSSNEMRFPNDHILLEELPDFINFKNVKTNQITTRKINKRLIYGLSNIYSVYDFYKKLYNDDILEELNNRKIINPSSTSSWSN